MDRYWKSNAGPDAPVTPDSNAGGYPADGNAAIGIDGTVPGAWWYHAMTEELRNAIIKLGGTPDWTKIDQLGTAIAASITQAMNGVAATLAKVATTGQYNDLLGKPTIPPQYALPPATTTALGGIIAGPGTTIAADGTLTANGLIKTVNTNSPDANGNVSAFVKNAKGTSSQYVGLVVFQGGTGDPLISMMQAAGVGTKIFGNGQAVQVDLVPATDTALGGVIAGPGLGIATDGTLSAQGTTIVNITASDSVALDLTPLLQGAPEILFNLPIAAGATCTLSITNPPAAGTLGEFVLAVSNGGAGSVLVWPDGVKWPGGAAPTLCGIAGKLDTFVLYSEDGGASWCAFIAAQGQ